MAEQKPFKDYVGRQSLAVMCDALATAMPGLDSEALICQALEGMDELELKQRIAHVIQVLRRFLPKSFPIAADILVRAGQSWDSSAMGGMGMFASWPIIDYVGEFGLEHPDLAMEICRQLTPLGSAEMAVRPFLKADPVRAMGHMLRWASDENEHVRRLASEGCRPRLPLAGNLPLFQKDPEPVIALLERLKDDSSEYVRRSVANNLNDIAKDHPEVVVAVCSAWSKGADKNRKRLIRHALRTLIKAGHPAVFPILGFTENPKVSVEALRVDPQSVKLGEDGIELRFVLSSKAESEQKLVLDYAVHHVKKNGTTTPKVFKLSERKLAANASVAIRKRHAIKPISTRRYYPGRHFVEVLINGVEHGRVGFDLEI